MFSGFHCCFRTKNISFLADNLDGSPAGGAVVTFTSRFKVIQQHVGYRYYLVFMLVVSGFSNKDRTANIWIEYIENPELF